MFLRLGEFVSRNWLWVILFWVLAVVGLRFVAPKWDDVTFDGDLAFLPAEMDSVRGDRLAREAFPQTRAKSQIVIIVSRRNNPLDNEDSRVADGIASRFHNRLAAIEFLRGEKLAEEADRLEQGGDADGANNLRRRARVAWETGLAECEEAIRLDELFIPAFHNRALFNERLGKEKEAEEDRETAVQFDPKLKDFDGSFVPANADDLPLVDVWTRHHEVFGEKLRSTDRKALLIVLQLTNEFMATDNIRVLGIVEEELAKFRNEYTELPGGLDIGISGSAAVGGDMLRAAAESIRHTELLTILLVIGILFLVYRSPFLIVVPLATIGVSLLLSTSLLALLTQLGYLPGFEWWGFKVFKTTRIFIIVILFGSGTDFCLFLISRVREELRLNEPVADAVATSIGKVGDAILGSALTTILGLAMMFFADFGKFRNSGPAIGLCLLVTLVACLTFAPAILCALGRIVFWPHAFSAAAQPRRSQSRWHSMARFVIRRPGIILTASVLILLPLAIAGWATPDRVTYDLLSELPENSSSTRGNELLARHFPVGESGPVILLARQPNAHFDDPDEDRAARAMAEIFEMTKRLTEIPGVHSVRSLAEPLGDPPKPMSLTSTAGIQKLFVRQHPLTKSIFLAQVEPHRGAITRFELVLEDNPFSFEAIQTLARIDEFLDRESVTPNTFWSGAEFFHTGTTAGIRDLRTVTRSDFWRITALVTIAVFTVILFLLRRPGVCLFLILSVLFSYLVTIGTTELFFQWLYGDSFVGLDWKVPIFLFVILVAVGQDYNIYLVTRVFEEQNQLGPAAGLTEAMVRTGGIITSCGIIMAGSFVSMTAGSLRGIVELGFALTAGILLDTFVIRSVVVPAFLALRLRIRGRQE